MKLQAVWFHRARKAVVILIGLVLALPSADADDSVAQDPAMVGQEVSWQQMAAMSLAAGGNKATCFNPLFKTHWAGKSDIRHLGAEPKLQQGLQLCQSYNAQKGCCLNSFEHVLSKAFQHWVTHWKRKSQNLKSFQIQMAKVKVSQVYVKADKLQRALFDRAVSSFSLVLKWHGTCFDTLLEYLAGMLCFACDPLWGKKVFLGQSGRSVDHLHVDDSSNEALWQGCRRLGAAASDMQTRVADSKLAKTIWLPLEDLSMLSSKIAVSQYMARLGLYALRGPSENLLVLSPGGGNAPGNDARLLAASSTGGPSGFVNPVRDGRASGFQCAVFPRIPFGLSSSMGVTVLFPWMLVFSSLW